MSNFVPKVLAMVLIFSFLSSQAHSEKIKFVYTGNSYSALYPCGSCPVSVGGGVSRRAAYLDSIADKQNLLLLDSGNFIAGGLFDSESINPDRDKLRTFFYLTTMQSMGYDALAIGENEFVFGGDFLKEVIKNFKLNYLSANIALEGIKPYLIKEVSGKKIAITALSPKSLYKKYGVEVGDYSKSLEKVFSELDNKYDVLILLSAIGDVETKNIIKKFPKINFAITSGAVTDTRSHEGLGQSHLLKPIYQAKALSIAEFNLTAKGISDFKVKDTRLSPELGESSKIKKLIPACFKDKDCKAREGLVRKCQDSGDPKATCAYYAAEKFTAKIVVDKSCSVCSTELTEEVLKENFLGINFKKIDYKSAEGKKLITAYKANTLPLFVVDPKIENEKNFEKFAKLFEKSGSEYLLKTDLSGVFLFLDRKEIKKRIDFFINLYDKDTKKVFSQLVSFIEKNKVKLKTYFLIPKKVESGYPLEEVKVVLAVGKKYPNKVNDYILLRAGQILQTSWVNTLDELGISYKSVQKVMNSDDMDTLLIENSSLVKEVDIRTGNVLLIKNTRIFKAFGIDEALLKKMF